MYKNGLLLITYLDHDDNKIWTLYHESACRHVGSTHSGGPIASAMQLQESDIKPVFCTVVIDQDLIQQLLGNIDKKYSDLTSIPIVAHSTISVHLFAYNSLLYYLFNDAFITILQGHDSYIEELKNMAFYHQPYAITTALLTNFYWFYNC